MPITVGARKTHTNGLIAKLEGIENRDMARELAGLHIGLERRSLPSTEEDEFYWIDLIKAQVSDTEGNILGTIQRFIETGAHDVIVISPTEQKSDQPPLLIPFIFGDTVQRVDLEMHKVVVRAGIV